MDKMFSFFPSKRAQGLSLNVIIIAVIAIIVLVVLVVIFTGKTKFFSSATTSCEAKGGSCTTVAAGGSCPEGFVTLMGAKCDTGQKCCSKFDVETKTSS